MPTYEFECPSGHVTQEVRPVAECSAPRTCECGQTATRIISRTVGYVQRECVYDSPVDGRPITSWAQRREDLARNGCQEYDPCMRQDTDRRLREGDAALDQAIEATVEAEIERMPARKRELLEQELKGGTTAEPTRLTAPAKAITTPLTYSPEHTKP